MIETGHHTGTGQPADHPALAPETLPGAEEVEGWIQRLQHDGEPLDDAARIDLIRALERLTCAAGAAQAVLTGEFEASQRARAAAAGVPTARQHRGIAAQIALARRESPHRGQQHLRLARVLRDELPHTMAAFRAGRITEWRATSIARETDCLTLADRQRVDADIAGDPEALEALGDGELVAVVRHHACTLDPASVAARRRRAESDRHTTLRPAPDTMTWFSALLPVKDGVSVHAALLREADHLKATGDPRSRGQLMADTLVHRVLHPHLAAVASGDQLPLTLNVLVPDTVLLGHGSTDQDADAAGGYLEGHGHVPADLLLELIAARLEAGLEVWVRRLYATPATGALVAMDSRARLFPPGLAGFLRLRDRTCRTPWCDAPIRHLDHAQDHDQGGPTSAANGQGLCEACNHAKQARGWRARPRPGPRHTIETVTPTGHTYRSTAPPARARPVRHRPPPSRPATHQPKLHLVYGGPELALALEVA